MSERTLRQSEEAAEQSGSSSLRASWLCGIAVGLPVTGIVVAIVGWLTPVKPGRPDFPVVLLIGTAAVAVALLIVLALWISNRRERHIPEAGRNQLGSSRTAAQDQSAVLRNVPVIAALGGLVVAALAWREVSADLEGGLLTHALPLFASGTTLLAVGGVLLVLVVRNPPSLSPADLKRGSVVGVTALVAVVGAATAVATAVVFEQAPIDVATSNSDRTAPASPSKPVVPDQAVWQWDAPVGTILGPDDIGAIPNGVAVRVGDGIIALDAETGKERWHYRISGAEVLNFGSTPSGNLVLVEFVTGNDVVSDDPGSRMVALDGGNGDVVSEHVFAEPSPMRAQREEGLDAFRLTDEVLVTGTLQGGRLVAHELPYGDPLWEWSTMPEGCRPSALDSTLDIVGSAALIPLACEGNGGSNEMRFVALDTTTGQKLWQYSSVVPGSLDEPLTVVESPDGSAAFLRWRWEGDDGGSRSVVLDTETGDELLPPTDGYGYSDLRVARNALMVIDSDGNLTWTPFDGDEPRRMTASCGELPWEYGHQKSRVSNSEALVQVCIPDSAKVAEIAVAPWRSARGVDTFDVDLAPGTAESRWSDWPHLIEFPELMLVLPDSGDRDRITALR